MKTELPFLVKWSEGPTDKRVTWWLMQSVQPNRYYGEVTNFARPLQINVEGSFLDGELATVHELIQDIRQRCRQNSETPQGEVNALLAVGSRAKPDILFRYSKGCEATNESARLFLRIVDLLRKYVDSNLDSAKSA